MLCVFFFFTRNMCYKLLQRMLVYNNEIADIFFLSLKDIEFLYFPAESLLMAAATANRCDFYRFHYRNCYHDYVFVVTFPALRNELR